MTKAKTGDMGIRFYCPNGHRLNVKDFLAGKRGICPHCAARFRIPIASELAKGAPRIQPNSPAARSVATVAASRSVSAVAAGVDESPDLDAPATELPVAESLASKSVEAEPVAVDAVLIESPLAASARSLESAPSPVMPGVSRELEFAAIDESPSSVWYVRPPSGGQYGPAYGDVLGKWISEGRVSADSMVWREGWADWQMAGAVFPGLKAAYTGAATAVRANDRGFPLEAAQATGSATNVTKAIGRSRNAARRKPIAAVIVLTLLILGLFVGLVFVLSTRT
jgi:hypothetical protein